MSIESRMTRDEQYTLVTRWLADQLSRKSEPSLETSKHVYFRLPEAYIRDDEHWDRAWDAVVIEAATGNWWIIHYPELPPVVEPDQLFV